MTPQLKSIQFCFFFASWLFVEIFTVGTGLANGVPRPVVKKYNVCTGCSKGSRGDKIIARCTQQV